MYFAGIDLAWSQKNKSGVALFRDNGKKIQLIETGWIRETEEVVSRILEGIGGERAVIAIDAPLVLTAQKGMRDVDILIGQIYQKKYGFSAFPGNSYKRGQEIKRLLEEKGFDHTLNLKAKGRGCFFEVYPHTAGVFFNKEIFRYKKRSGRKAGFRIKELIKYSDFLKALKDIAYDEKAEVFDPGYSARPGYSKKLEDQLDAVFCGYIAYRFWKDPSEYVVLNDPDLKNPDKDYILAPADGEVRKFMRDRSLPHKEFR